MMGPYEDRVTDIEPFMNNRAAVTREVRRIVAEADTRIEELEDIMRQAVVIIDSDKFVKLPVIRTMLMRELKK